jgi:hypothetical protein
MPDANTLFNIAERLSASFGIALLATYYTARSAVTGSPVAAARLRAAADRRVRGRRAGRAHAPGPEGGAEPGGLPPRGRACDDGCGRQ